MVTNRTAVLIHLDPEQAAALAALAERKGCSRSALLREAADLVLGRDALRQALESSTKALHFFRPVASDRGALAARALKQAEAAIEKARKVLSES